MEISIEEIQNKFDSLPEDLKWAIMDANVDETITEIGKANGLSIEHMGQLSLETHMVMLGFVKPEDFETSLKNSMGLPPEKITPLVNAVNERILKKIRENIIEARKPEAEKQEEIPNLEETMKTLEIKEELPPATVVNPSPIAQKLSAPYVAPVEKKEYKPDEVPKKDVPAAPMPTPEKPKVDPYREIPE